VDVFRASLSLGVMGVGFDATVTDPEALAYLAFNHQVWRKSEPHWDLVSDLLPWLEKLVHSMNRNRTLNYSLLEPLGVVEWVLNAMLLAAYEGPGERAHGLAVLKAGASVVEVRGGRPRASGPTLLTCARTGVLPLRDRVGAVRV
jgi:hypothetical protein